MASMCQVADLNRGVDGPEATAGQLKALAHPLRWRILRLCRDTARTNQELAGRLGVAAPTMLRHVRLLVGEGFLRAEAPRVGPAGGTERPYRATGLTLRLHMDDPDASELRRQVDLAVLAAHSSEVAEAGPGAVRDTTRGVLRLGSGAQRALTGRLTELLNEYRGMRDEDGEDLSFLWHLARRPDGPEGHADATSDKRRTVVVTGATGGIGAAVAEAISARGDRVVALGRSADHLDALFAASPAVTPAIVDLLEPESLPPVLAEVRRVDALIHCAEIAEVSAVADTTLGEWHRMMSVNVVGAAELTRTLLPGLRRAGGQVVFVNASPNRRAAPGWSAYAASKAAQRELADSLRAEEEGNGIRVTTIFPGTVGIELLQVRAAPGRPCDEGRAVEPAAVASVVLTVLDQPRSVHLTDVSLRAASGTRS
jgi:NADP-dependent 3-hydroxy acid dehydrogenase YdfG